MRALACLLCLISLTGCSMISGWMDGLFGRAPSPVSSLSGWVEEDHQAALATFKRSCAVFATKPQPVSQNSAIHIDKDVWGTLCAEANRTKNARAFFETYFTLYPIQGESGDTGLFTGYYEPLLYGSLTKEGPYQYPIYHAPEKATSLTRKEIEAGALAGRQLEIAWVDDPVMLFFMQVQGSGRVRLADGSEFMVGYGGNNGRDYVSIGKELITAGEMTKEEMNFFSLRQWLYDHPLQARKLMQQNSRYIFFKKLKQKEVIGAVGVPLTPKRSIAIDPSYIPYGLPLYLETTLPAMPGAEEQPFKRLMIAQDTGSAIRGAVRGDVFFGHGQEAEYLAGYMKQQGRYTLLLPKAVSLPVR